MRRFTAMKTFIENLERIRVDRGLTQVELAELLGTTQGNISRLLNGGEDIRLSRCEKIARTLGVPLTEMLEESVPAHS
jgi:transcriptional regulator with XRE-family HTH domain